MSDFSLERQPLTYYLSCILKKYPLGGQILKVIFLLFVHFFYYETSIVGIRMDEINQYVLEKFRIKNNV
jgi:hypothetical protein